MTTTHNLRNYSAKTMRGYCLTCNGLTDIRKAGGEYRCVADWTLSIDPRKPQMPHREPDRLGDKVESIRAKTDRLQRLYSLSWFDYLSLLDNANYACQICNEPFTPANPAHIDHDHSCCKDKTSCGKCVRGLLCRTCNSGLGHFRDNATSLLNGYQYITQWTNTTN